MLLKLPYSAGCLRRNIGCEAAPAAIEAMLEKPKPKTIELKLDDSAVSASLERIKSTVSNYLAAAESRPLLVLGGDHSISGPCFEALRSQTEDAGLLVLDAHPDVMPATKAPSHEDWLRLLVERRLLAHSRLVLVGIRNVHPAEAAFLREHGIKSFDMASLFEFGVLELADSIMEAVRDFGALHLSLDIDVADPAFAPGTGCPEPGGLSSRELLYLGRRFSKLRNLALVDVVEVNPTRDREDMTTRLTAAFIRTILGE